MGDDEEDDGRAGAGDGGGGGGEGGGGPGISPKGIVEAALFSAGRPLEKEEIVEATGLSGRDVHNALTALIKDYRDNDSALVVGKVGDKYAMALKARYADHARKLAEMEIPLKVLKTAALIAFHQPLKQSDLLDMIGSKVYDHVGVLTELGLVQARSYERTKLLTTTDRFSEYFGIDTTDKAEIKRWLADKVGVKLESMGESLDDYGGGDDGAGSGADEASGEEGEKEGDPEADGEIVGDGAEGDGGGDGGGE